MPLASQADTDVRQGAFALGRARAEAVLHAVGASTPLGSRARSIRDRAAAELRAGALTPDPDRIYEPLVQAAETDGAAGRRALAQARLNAALAGLPQGSALATRARNLLAIMGGGSAPSGGAQTGGGIATEPVPPPPTGPRPTAQQVAVQPSAPPAGSGPNVVAAGARPGSSSANPVRPTDGEPERPSEEPDIRSGAEMTELYTALFGYGAFAMISTLVWLDASDPFLIISLPFVGGAGGVAIAVVMDAEPSRLRAGVPSAISTGMLVGLGDAFLVWGAIEEGLSDDAIFGLLLAGATAGTLAGAVVGYGLAPTVAENRLVLSAAAWGAAIGSMSGLGLDLDGPTTWRTALAATNVAAGLAIVISTLEDIPMKHVLELNGMVMVGGMVGLMVAGIVHLERNRDDREPNARVTWGSLAIGMGAGLGLGILLVGTDDDDDPDAADAGESGVGLAAVPVPGGAMLTAYAPL